MAIVAELLCAQENGNINFGNYTLQEKKKVEDFENAGSVYKVKTFAEITKLEKNGMFLYESVPGTSVVDFAETEKGVSFVVEGNSDSQITLGLLEEAEYEVSVNGENVGTMKTGLSGKLSLSVALTAGEEVAVEVTLV